MFSYFALQVIVIARNLATQFSNSEYALFFNKRVVLSYGKCNIATMTNRARFQFLGFIPTVELSALLAQACTVFVEPLLSGDFVKFNSNNGAVTSSNNCAIEAFSHWTFQYSKGAHLLCDIQGVQSTSTDQSKYLVELTDPCIHSSISGSFGATDFGVVGQLV